MTFARSVLIISFVGVVLRFSLPQTATAYSITPENLIKLTNQVRINNGLKPLTISEKLHRAAQNKAGDLVLKNYWSHTTPEGKPFWVFADEVGYQWSFLGENLAADFKTADGVISAWLLSHPHRKNILNARYDEIGIGVKNNIIVALYGKEGDRVITQIQKISSWFSKILNLGI